MRGFLEINVARVFDDRGSALEADVPDMPKLAGAGLAEKAGYILPAAVGYRCMRIRRAVNSS